MKRFAASLLAILMTFSLSACGETHVDSASAQSTPASAQSAPSSDQNSLSESLEEISSDFSGVTSNFTLKLEETFTSVGTTYEDYQKNKGLIDEWIDFVLSESDALFTRTRENSIAYFKLIAADPDHEYSEFCDEALDQYYDTVYDKAMDEYYDVIYDEALDDLYNAYYDGIIDDAYNDIEYSEWSNTSSECYQTWSDASSAIYKKWSDESSYIYGLWLAMSSAFCYDNNYDVDAIVAEYDKEKAEADAEKAAEEAKEYIDFDVLYEINADGKAEVVGFSGEGNQLTIDSEYEGKDVVRIADSAFEGCTSLERVVIWAELKEIGNSAFKGCTGLTEFSVPNATEVIGHHAFEGCSNLEDLTIWGSPDIGEYAFADCVALTEISIGSDTKNIGAHAFEGCTGATSLVIWGADIIGDYAFSGCAGIEDVSIPSDVRSIGNHAFDGCASLSSVIVWSDDTAIGKDAFANCPNLDNAPSERGTVLESTMSESESIEDNVNAVTEDSTQNESTETVASGIRPEFKEAMDSYEAFYTEYCEFMKEYNENPSDLALLAKYSDMISKA